MVADWRGLLGQMNNAILTDPLVEDFALPSEVIQTGWIGYEPATEEQITAAEARLGLALPPSYREFLQVSNGWRVCNPYMDAVFPVEKIDFTRNTDPDLILNWENRADAAAAQVTDIAYTIQISERTDMAILLLNPMKIAPDGEWEAWFYTDNIPGAEVFPSFWDLMQDQLAGQLDARENTVPRSAEPIKPDQREEVVSAIQHVRQGWLMTAEYDALQGEIDVILARIQALPAADQEAFQAGLRVLLVELKGGSVNSRESAQTLLTALINSDANINDIEFLRRQANLFIATVIESHAS